MIKVRSQYQENITPRANAGGKKYIVDVAGFVPKEKQLQNLIRSGEQLIEWQKEVYKNLEVQGQDNAEYTAPLSDYGYDYFDAVDDYTYLRNTLTQADVERKKREEYAKRVAEQQAEKEQKQSARPRADSTSGARVVPEQENPADYVP